MKPLHVSYDPLSDSLAGSEDVFFRFIFDDKPCDDDRSFSTGLPQIHGSPVGETWRCQYPFRTIIHDSVVARVCDDYLMASAQISAASLRVDTQRVYQQLLDFIHAQGFEHIVRMWNIVPDITGGEGDQERYKQFCLGRAEAFDGHHLVQQQPPAASAVGSQAGQPLRVFMLAARQASVLIENPRQVSAFSYPRAYGPRSPSFSRASLLRSEGCRQMFLSGTASIVGHESLHPESVSLQLQELFENIRTLTRNAELNDARSILRVYVRDIESIDVVCEQISSLVTESERLVFVAADICRRELLVEVDGLIECTQHHVA